MNDDDYTSAEEWDEYAKARWPWMPARARLAAEAPAMLRELKRLRAVLEDAGMGYALGESGRIVARAEGRET